MRLALARTAKHARDKAREAAKAKAMEEEEGGSPLGVASSQVAARATQHAWPAEGLEVAEVADTTLGAVLSDSAAAGKHTLLIAGSYS